MSVASVADLKEELTFSGDLGEADDGLMERHLAAAEELLQHSLGFLFAEEYPDPAPVPAALKQAVLWLAVDFYEGRGNPAKGSAMPFHVEQIVQAYREWSF